jgi:O-methyltransferase involved in polyketide biosynthesis
MNSVNKTLYIPLYGKSYVSKKGLFLDDKKAEEIWATEGFPLQGKAKSKWLAYYMGVRSAVFDEWLKQQMSDMPNAVILHIGCGLDSRILRVGANNHKWYDLDFPQVIEERKRYYTETEQYKMLAADARDVSWLTAIPETDAAIVVMEGVSMYLTVEEMQSLMDGLSSRFAEVVLLVDAYTSLAAKMSKRRNPINEVGVSEVYGIDNPRSYQNEMLVFEKEYAMIPQKFIDQLKGFEKFVFSKLYAGSLSKKLYRLFAYKKQVERNEG